MKKTIIFLFAAIMMAQNANALLVSVSGHGEISVEGMEITINEAELDPMTEKPLMELNGSLLCSGNLTVIINRSEAGLEDEFCCADQCRTGSGEKSDTLQYTPTGKVNWFAHYTPAANSNVTIVYLFSDNTESRTLTVHYVYQTESIENVNVQKQQNGIYSLNGVLLNKEGNVDALPNGIYIQDGTKIIKSNH